MKSASRLDWQYLLFETVLILGWSYVIFLGGTINGFINFKIQLLNFILGFVLFLGWLFYTVIKDKKVDASGIEWGLLIFIISQVIATAFSQDLRRSLSTLAIYISYSLIFYVLVNLAKGNRNRQLLQKTLLIGGAIATGLILYSVMMEYIGWKTLVAGLDYPPAFKRRVYLILGDANLIAAFVNILTPLVILAIIKAGHWLQRILLFLYLAGLVSVQYFCSSRGGMLALFAEVGLLLICWIWVVPGVLQKLSRQVWSWFRQHTVILVLAALIILATGGLAVHRFLNFEGDATHAPVASARSVFWRAAFNAFSSDPFTGIGPGIYPSAYMLEDSMPPGRPFIHAHSIPFTFMAESGIIGLLGIAVLVAVILWQAWKRIVTLRSTDADRRQWIIALSVLAGAAVHGLVDNFLVYYVFGLPIILVTIDLIGTERDDQGGKLSPVWLAIPAILLSVFQIYSLRAAIHHERGIEYGITGAWELASGEFETAADLDPQFGLYWIESAVAHSHLSGNESLVLAIDELNKGINKEPNFSVNHANLAALYWENGQRELAIETLQRALVLAPKAEWYWLAMKQYGHEMEEADLFDDPGAELHQSGVVSEAELRLQTVLDLINGDKLSIAREQAEAGWKNNDQEPLVYLALAEVYQAESKYDIAKRYLDAGLWVQTPHNRDKLLLLVKRAEMAKSMGLLEEAQENYNAAYSAMMDTTMYGWGSKGFTPYAWFVFQRRSLPVDIVPQFPMIANENFCSKHGDCVWGK